MFPLATSTALRRRARSTSVMVLESVTRLLFSVELGGYYPSRDIKNLQNLKLDQ